MKNKPQTQIEKVNKLVEMSFGRGFSGNRILFSNSSGSHMVEADRLESIAKRGWPYILRLIERYEVIGRFTSEDGSSLNINPEYLNGAERYALLYKLDSGKDVLIKVNGLKE